MVPAMVVPAMVELLAVLGPLGGTAPLAVSVLAPLAVPEPERPAGWVALEGRVVLVVAVVLVAPVAQAEA